MIQVAGRGRGKARWPQWATGSEGLQAGQDLAWGHSGGHDPGTGPGACLFSKPGTDAWVIRTSAVQSTSHPPTILRMYPNPYIIPVPTALIPNKSPRSFFVFINFSALHYHSSISVNSAHFNSHINVEIIHRLQLCDEAR